MAGKVAVGLMESNVSLLLGLWLVSTVGLLSQDQNQLWSTSIGWTWLYLSLLDRSHDY